ncbi:undecaprenyl/decaprenyl-phosphate alpha-N-acetylglucosaminyl 1-phosphate transferase [bacterium]|nr:undecaprenyl/decaprenyl-phosphate alpha-N-acetylglucosaminyl 1-phosphate transferase [bacterium]
MIVYGILIFAALLELILANIFTHTAKKMKIMDKPNERKMHKEAKPRGIGVSFFIVYVIGLLLLHLLGVKIPFISKYLLWIILGGVIFLLGLFDDIFNLNPYIKFGVQLAVALAFSIFIEKVTFFIKVPAIQITITTLWIIGIMNSFNLLDNMDGLSSGIAFITTLIFALFNFQIGNSQLSILFLLLSAVMIGFLPVNFYPAQCFMGDSGSLFIGYVISTLSIMGVYTSFSRLRHLPVIVPLLILSVPIYDTFSVIYIRLKNKKSIFVGDKNHFSHRLFNLGLSHKNAVLFIYLVTFATGMISLLITKVNWLGALILLGEDLILFTLLSILISVKGKK